MASPVDVTMILCDSAVADPGGKVHMLGAGWSVTGCPTAGQAVVLLIKVPWDRANQKIPMSIELLSEDGQAVRLGEGAEESPIHLTSTIEVGRPAGLAHGSMIDASFVLNVGPMPLTPARYDWRATVGQTTTTRTFTVQAA